MNLSILSVRNIFFALAMAGALMMALAPLATQAQFATPTNTSNLAPSTDQTIAGVIVDITEFLAGLLAVLAILVIVIAGILYITSGGDDGRIQLAKSMLIYAIIGLIVALLAYVIVLTVANALGAGA